MAFLLFRFQLSEIDSDEMLQMFMNKDEVLDLLEAISFSGNIAKTRLEMKNPASYEVSDSVSVLLRD